MDKHWHEHFEIGLFLSDTNGMLQKQDQSCDQWYQLVSYCDSLYVSGTQCIQVIPQLNDCESSKNSSRTSNGSFGIQDL